MLFEMSSERRRDDAVDALYTAGHDARKPPRRLYGGYLLEVDVAGTTAETEVTSIVTGVDPGAQLTT